MLTYDADFNPVDTDKYNNLIGKDLWVACDVYDDAARPQGICDYVYMRLRKTMQDYIECNVLYDPEYWFSDGELSYGTLYRVFRLPDRIQYDHIVVCEPLELLTTEEFLEAITTPEVVEAVMRDIDTMNQENGWDL